MNWGLLFLGVVLMCVELLHEASAMEIKVTKIEPKLVEKLVKKTENSRPWEVISDDPQFLHNMLQLHYLCSTMLRPAIPEGNIGFLQNWARKQLIKKTPIRNTEKVQTIMNMMCQKIYSHKEGQFLLEKMPVKHSPRSSITSASPRRTKSKSQKKFRSHEGEKIPRRYDYVLKKLQKESKSDSDLDVAEKEEKSNIDLTNSNRKSHNKTAFGRNTHLGEKSRNKSNSKDNPSSNGTLKPRNTTEQNGQSKLIAKPETENPKQDTKYHVQNKHSPEQKTDTGESWKLHDKLNQEVAQDSILPAALTLQSKELTATDSGVKSKIERETGGISDSNVKDDQTKLGSNKEPGTDVVSGEKPQKADGIEPEDDDLDRNQSPEINETVPSHQKRT